jgi:hypothetical protein
LPASSCAAWRDFCRRCCSRVARASAKHRQCENHEGEPEDEGADGCRRAVLNAYLYVQNVYNHRYAEGLSYSCDYAQSKPQTGLPILAIFGARGEI